MSLLAGSDAVIRVVRFAKTATVTPSRPETGRLRQILCHIILLRYPMGNCTMWEAVSDSDYSKSKPKPIRTAADCGNICAVNGVQVGAARPSLT